jgi:hypothetical protein
MQWSAVFAAGAVMMLLAAPAQAVTINSGPMDWSWEYDGSFTGGDVAGGSFNTGSGGNQLVSFSLTVGQGSGSNDLRAVVLEVSGGVPTGNVIWESASFSAGVIAEMLFTPGVALALNGQYFVGIDSGLYTSATGGDFVVGVTADLGQVPGGGYWENSDDFFAPGFTPQSGVITSTMELVLVPEPTSLSLLGLGLLGLGVAKRRRQRAS